MTCCGSVVGDLRGGSVSIQGSRQLEVATLMIVTFARALVLARALVFVLCVG